MPRLFYAGCIGDTCPSVRYLMKEETERFQKTICKPLLESKAKLSPQKSVEKFKCQIWSDIARKLAKKCLDASSL